MPDGAVRSDGVTVGLGDGVASDCRPVASCLAPTGPVAHPSANPAVLAATLRVARGALSLISARPGAAGFSNVPSLAAGAA